MTLRLLAPWLLACLVLTSALAAPAALTPVPDALAASPSRVIIPAPQRAEFPAGTLPLTGLALKLVGDAPELGWAARDLTAEWQTRLETPLPDSGAVSITIGTRADAGLAAKARAAGLYTEQPEGYALWVDASGAYIVGADAKGAYYGAQTLRQLLTPAGLRFARIQDFPGLRQRVAMIYLDSYSKGVNDRLIPMLAELKYNAALIMSNYVQWDVAKSGGWASPAGASKAEAARVAALARSYGLEPIPLIETLGHVAWMFQGGKNLDLVQDPQSQNPYAYDTLNPDTYNRVIFPVLKEAVETFKPQADPHRPRRGAKPGPLSGPRERQGPGLRETVRGRYRQAPRLPQKPEGRHHHLARRGLCRRGGGDLARPASQRPDGCFVELQSGSRLPDSQHHQGRWASPPWARAGATRWAPRRMRRRR